MRHTYNEFSLFSLLFHLQRRLQKELMSLIKEPPPGVVVDAESISQNLTQ